MNEEELVNLEKYKTELGVDYKINPNNDVNEERERIEKIMKKQLLKARISKEQKEQIEKELQKDDEKLVEAYNKSVSNIVELKDYYNSIYVNIEKIKLGYLHSLFVKGRTGIGKSKNIENALKKLKVDYVELTGNLSPAYLYRLFFENNGKVFWFKETTNLLNNPRTVTLLKSATEEWKEFNFGDEKIKGVLLTNHNYSKQQADLPHHFIFNGSVIFDFNNTPIRNDEDYKALIGRGELIEISLSFDDLAQIMRRISITKEQKEVCEFLIKNYEFVGYNLFNLRTLTKAFLTRKYAEQKHLDWKELLLQELKSQNSEVRNLLYSLIGNKAVTTTTLKKLLVRNGTVGTVRTASRRIQEWLEIGELYKIGEGERNFYVSINKI